MLIRSANNAAESKGKITNKYFRIEKLTFFSYLKSDFFLFQNYEETQSLVHIK